MTYQRNVFGRYTIIGFLFVLCLGLNMACSSDKKRSDAEPAKVIESDSRYFIDLDAEQVIQLLKGDTLAIAVNDSTRFNLIVRRVSQPMKGVHSIAADIEHKEMGTASLVVQDGSVAGNLNVFDREDILYVRYDSLKNQHFIRPVSKEDLDIIEGGTPLKPPTRNY